MQKIVTSIVGFMLFLVYWSVHDSIDSTLFGPSQAAEIKSPEQAVYAIDIYPGAKVTEHNREHYESDEGEGDAAVWRYTWSLDVPQSAAVVTDFYKRRIGEPVKSDEEYFAYEETVFEKTPNSGKKGELTRVVVVPNPENGHTYLFIEQDIASNASSLGWKTRRNIVHFVILGGIFGVCTLGLFVMKKLSKSDEGFSEPITTYSPPPPSVVPQPEAPEAPPAPPGPASDDVTFFEELEAKIAADHPDWKIKRERFELTVMRQGKAPVTNDIEPLFYLWKRPGVDRAQAITQFLDGRIK